MKPSPDVPIQNQKEDRLNRATFAAALAEALRNWHDAESLVVALFGGWGTGKSSLKNLAINYLLSRRGTIPTVVHFNPWLVNGQEQLLHAFFRELTIALVRPFGEKTHTDAANILNKWLAYVEVLGGLTESVSQLMTTIGVPFAGIGAMTGKATKSVAAMVNSGAKAEKALTETNRKSLIEIKAELREALAATGQKPILVVIDDIDRLATDEICLLFRLIKANADFPKFIFFLLCDREVVSAALESITPKRGSEFLEKIVQVAFDVPDLDPNLLHKIVKADWNNILSSSTDARGRADDDRVTHLLTLSRPYITNVRAARRWMNGVRFTFGAFHTRNGFNANAEDLLGVELLRIFEPALYRAIPCRKSDLTYSQWDFSLRYGDNDQAREAIRDSLLEAVAESKRQAALQILNWLFPNARWQVMRTPDSVLLRDLRVGHSDCFERYFRFVLGKETLTRREVKEALSASQNLQKFRTLVESEIAENRLELWLDNLKSHAETLRVTARNVVRVLFDVSDALPDRQWTFGGFGMQSAVIQFVMSVLNMVPDQSERTEILLEAMESTEGVMVPVLLAMYECYPEYRMHRQESELIVNNTTIAEAKRRALVILEKRRESPCLRDAIHVGFVLNFWKENGKLDVAGEWIRGQFERPTGVWQILRSVATHSQSGDQRTFLKVDVVYLANLIPIEEVATAVSQASLEGMTEELLSLKRLFEEGMAAIPGTATVAEVAKTGEISV